MKSDKSRLGVTPHRMDKWVGRGLVCGLLALIAAAIAFSEPASEQSQTCAAGRQFLREHLAALGVDLTLLEVPRCGEGTAAVSLGPSNQWSVVGRYWLPWSESEGTVWRIEIYGPVNGNRWATCRLYVDHQLVPTGRPHPACEESDRN